MRFIEPRPRHRLTDRKIGRAMLSLEALLYCRDLPEEPSGPHGDVRSALELTLVDVIGPLLQIIEDTDR